METGNGKCVNPKNKRGHRFPSAAPVPNDTARKRTLPILSKGTNESKG